MDHSPGFLKIVDDARKTVSEVTIQQAQTLLAKNPQAVFMDVREDSEWQAGHAAQAIHLGKGILERDLEKIVPEKDRLIIMYCGGGFRSVLTASAAKQMGYTNVHSLIGGYKALVASDWPMIKG